MHLMNGFNQSDAFFRIENPLNFLLHQLISDVFLVIQDSNKNPIVDVEDVQKTVSQMELMVSQ